MTAPSDPVLARGRYHHVPFVIGSNSDETALELAKAYPSGMTTAQYQAAVLAYAKNDPTLAGEIEEASTRSGATRRRSRRTSR